MGSPCLSFWIRRGPAARTVSGGGYGHHVDTRAAAQRWADVWKRGWVEHDEAAIMALYAEGGALAAAPVPRPSPPAAAERDLI